MARLGWRTRKIYALLPVAIVVAVAALAGPFHDAFLGVSGTVYEWTNAPVGQHSLILWEEGVPEGAAVVPMVGADVTVFHGRDRAKEPTRGSTGQTSDAVTDENGTFSTSSSTSRETNHAVLWVRHDGFCSVDAEFAHPNPERKEQINHLGHTATVLMVRKP